MDLPDIVNEINKKKKTTKITTLDLAKSFRLKRFFSGSFGTDYITGGGFAYRRIQLLFGAKSCIDGDSFLWYEIWKNNKRANSKGGTIRNLYKRFTDVTKTGRKPMSNDLATYYVKSVDDEGYVVRNEILNVVKTGKKKCFEVSVSSGEQLTSTMEHKYLTPSGYKELKDLKVGDIVYVNRNNRVKGRKKHTSRPAICVKYHPYFPVKIVKDKYKGVEKDYPYYRGQQSRIVYEACLNDMTYDQYVSILNTASKEEINKLKFLPVDIHVHHKDENFLNNDISNLELIDPSEHGKLHMLDRLKNLMIIVDEATILSIEPVGERETFDIQCAYPYNNYIANGIVVHNSGKNALLNQTTAYLQRQCRCCHGVHPDFFSGAQAKDQWAFILHSVMGYGICKCEAPQPKKVFILDFERALAIEETRSIKILNITNNITGDDIDELDYNDAIATMAELQVSSILTPEQKIEIKKCEDFIKNCSIKEQTINQIAITDYLKKCGVDINQLLVADPEDTEEGIELVRDMIRAKEVDAIIWDSLQAAIPRYVKDRAADQATMGVEAKQNGLLMRHVCSAFAAANLLDESEAYKPALFITSQVRAAIGGFTSLPDTYSGGNAIQHHISLALEVKREKFLKEDGTDAEFKDDFYGQRVRLRADKNKLSSPGDMYEYEYFFREGENFPVGIDSVGELINLGVKVGLIDRAGPYYSVGDKKFQGMKALKDAFRGDSKFAQEIYIQLIQKL